MNHPIILACVTLRGQWFSVKQATELAGFSHSTVRHRLDGLAAAGVLERRVIKQHLLFHVRQVARLCAIRDGQEPMPNAADTRAAPHQLDGTLQLAQLFGYVVKQLPGVCHRHHKVDSHNPDATSRAASIHRFSSLEIIC